MADPEGPIPILYVEGSNDAHAIRALLGQHEIKCRIEGKGSPPDSSAPNVPQISSGDGKDNLLSSISAAVRLSGGRPVAFVLDADIDPADRWREVCTQYRRVGIEPPNEIPVTGFVADAGAYGVRTGCWLMPDNRREGTLEQFLETLVDEGDPLLPFADSSTHSARSHGAKFPEAKRPKAVLHAWLAWQEDPGLRYGSAIWKRYFRHDSPAALAFVDWFRRVFEK